MFVRLFGDRTLVRLMYVNRHKLREIGLPSYSVSNDLKSSAPRVNSWSKTRNTLPFDQNKDDERQQEELHVVCQIPGPCHTLISDRKEVIDEQHVVPAAFVA